MYYPVLSKHLINTTNTIKKNSINTVVCSALLPSWPSALISNTNIVYSHPKPWLMGFCTPDFFCSLFSFLDFIIIFKYRMQDMLWFAKANIAGSINCLSYFIIHPSHLIFIPLWFFCAPSIQRTTWVVIYTVHVGNCWNTWGFFSDADMDIYKSCYKYYFAEWRNKLDSLNVLMYIFTANLLSMTKKKPFVIVSTECHISITLS